MLMTVASAVFLGTESLGTRDHNNCIKFETSLFIASYDSQGHGGGIEPRLHTGNTTNFSLLLSLLSLGADQTENIVYKNSSIVQ
jgi:hypothetical protein